MAKKTAFYEESMLSLTLDNNKILRNIQSILVKAQLEGKSATEAKEYKNWFNDQSKKNSAESTKLLS